MVRHRPAVSILTLAMLLVGFTLDAAPSAAAEGGDPTISASILDVVSGSAAILDLPAPLDGVAVMSALPPAASPASLEHVHRQWAEPMEIARWAWPAIYVRMRRDRDSLGFPRSPRAWTSETARTPNWVPPRRV